jgi:hypothetical protein
MSNEEFGEVDFAPKSTKTSAPAWPAETPIPPNAIASVKRALAESEKGSIACTTEERRLWLLSALRAACAQVAPTMAVHPRDVFNKEGDMTHLTFTIGAPRGAKKTAE